MTHLQRKVTGRCASAVSLTVSAMMLMLLGPSASALAGPVYPVSAGSLPKGWMGASVSVSRNVAVAGAPAAAKYAGVAVVFARSPNGTWHLQATLRNPASRTGTGFATSVAASGTTALVGAPYASYQKHRVGLVYAYERVNGAWRLRAKLHDPQGSAFDGFGSGIAMSGTTAVITARNTVLIFGRQPGGSWALRTTLTNPGTDDGFGSSSPVAISGGTVAVGDTLASVKGAVYVFAHSSSGWHLQATLADPDKIKFDTFPTSVSAYGSTIAAGAEYTNNTGIVHVFTRSGTSWRWLQRLRDPSGFQNDRFGAALSVWGTRMVIGAPGTSAYGCGSAWEFTRPRTAWKLRAKVINPGCSPGDDFGTAVSLSGRISMIGAPTDNNYAGDVYLQVLP